MEAVPLIAGAISVARAIISTTETFSERKAILQDVDRNLRNVVSSLEYIDPRALVSKANLFCDILDELNSLRDEVETVTAMSRATYVLSRAQCQQNLSRRMTSLQNYINTFNTAQMAEVHRRIVLCQEEACGVPVDEVALQDIKRERDHLQQQLEEKEQVLVNMKIDAGELRLVSEERDELKIKQYQLYRRLEILEEKLANRDTLKHPHSNGDAAKASDVHIPKHTDELEVLADSLPIPPTFIPKPMDNVELLADAPPSPPTPKKILVDDINDEMKLLSTPYCVAKKQHFDLPPTAPDDYMERSKNLDEDTTMSDIDRRLFNIIRRSPARVTPGHVDKPELYDDSMKGSKGVIDVISLDAEMPPLPLPDFVPKQFRIPSNDADTSPSLPDSETCLPSTYPKQVGDTMKGPKSFGEAVALSSNGKRVAIGAPRHPRGLVRIYNLSGSEQNLQWTQVGQDLAWDGYMPLTGWAVSLSHDGNRVVIGDPSGRGLVKVFDLCNTQWIQVGTDLTGGDNHGSFGWTVALSSDGRFIAVGAPCLSSGNFNKIGRVSIYFWFAQGSQWKQVGDDLVGETAGDSFGRAIAISSNGSRVAVGAPSACDLFSREVGQVRVYHRDGLQWVQDGQVLFGPSHLSAVRADRSWFVRADSEGFGSAVALSSDGTRIAIGAPVSLEGNRKTNGLVQIYDFVGDQWFQAGDDLIGQRNEKRFGQSVALSSNGHCLVIGAGGALTSQVTICDWLQGGWIPTQICTSQSRSWCDDNTAVSISADGIRTVIGASFGQSSARDFSVLSENSGGYVEIYEKK